MNLDSLERCPVCSVDLSQKKRHGVRFGVCPRCGTLWVGHGEFGRALELERHQSLTRTRSEKARDYEDLR